MSDSLDYIRKWKHLLKPSEIARMIGVDKASFSLILNNKVDSKGTTPKLRKDAEQALDALVKDLRE